jgi:hypothetical protein
VTTVAQLNVERCAQFTDHGMRSKGQAQSPGTQRVTVPKKRLCRFQFKCLSGNKDPRGVVIKAQRTGVVLALDRVMMTCQLLPRKRDPVATTGHACVFIVSIDLNFTRPSIWTTPTLAAAAQLGALDVQPMYRVNAM